jgi:predicted  nucleic acid-binding Zn-ribbon protein
MSAYFWVVLGLFVVATTKYLTSVRLRGLTDRMHREHADAQELRYTLVQAEEKETQLKTETERLQAKVSGLRNVIGNLERSLQRYKGS